MKKDDFDPMVGALPLQCPPKDRGHKQVLFTFYLDSIMGTTKQALGYTLRATEMKLGKFAGKKVTIATAHPRGRVSFDRF